MKIAIFLCYGLFEESNQEYKDYVDFAAKEIAEKKIDRLILCGGYTNPQKNISESETVFNYLKLAHSPSCQIVLETESLTTSQNLQFASRYFSHTADNITIYCDLYRMAKVIWLSAHFLLQKTRKEIINSILEYNLERKITPFSSWNLTVIPFDFPSRDKYQALGQSFSSLLEIEAIYDPNLDEEIVSHRKKEFGIK